MYTAMFVYSVRECGREGERLHTQINRLLTECYEKDKNSLLTSLFRAKQTSAAKSSPLIFALFIQQPLGILIWNFAGLFSAWFCITVSVEI